MTLIQPLIIASVLLSAATFNAQASLSFSTGTDGAGLFYSSISNITWTQDANLLGTFETTRGFSTVVNAIIAANPTINDTPNSYDTPADSGHHTVTAADFQPGGRASWFGAQAFITYLNSINYGGSKQWRLPTSDAIVGYGGGPGNELGILIDVELNGPVGSQTYDSMGFKNVQSLSYWSGTEFAPNLNRAWGYQAYIGGQGPYDKLYPNYAWAVSPGQMVAVPVPTSVPVPDVAWLMASGLLGLLASKRRGHAQ